MLYQGLKMMRFFSQKQKVSIVTTTSNLRLINIFLNIDFVMKMEKIIQDHEGISILYFVKLFLTINLTTFKGNTFSNTSVLE